MSFAGFTFGIVVDDVFVEKELEKHFESDAHDGGVFRYARMEIDAAVRETFYHLISFFSEQLSQILFELFFLFSVAQKRFS